MGVLSFATRMWARLVRRRLSDEVAQELDLHIALLTERYLREGMARAEAEAMAMRRVGNVTHIREEVHELTRLGWLDDLGSDLAHGIRTIRRAPGFSTVVVATLALGMGATSAIFSIVNTVLLTPSPAPDPDRVVVLATTFPEGSSYLTSDQKFNVWRQQTDVLQDIAGRRSGVVNLTNIDRPEQVQATWVTEEYFRLYGIPIATGRSFSGLETVPNGPPAAVLSDGVWKRAFGADPRIIGRRISISDAPFEVVGVAAAGVRTLSGDPIDIWLPLATDPASASQVTTSWWRRDSDPASRCQLRTRSWRLRPTNSAAASPTRWPWEPRPASALRLRAMHSSPTFAPPCGCCSVPSLSSCSSRASTSRTSRSPGCLAGVAKSLFAPRLARHADA